MSTESGSERRSHERGTTVCRPDTGATGGPFKLPNFVASKRKLHAHFSANSWSASWVRFEAVDSGVLKTGTGSKADPQTFLDVTIRRRGSGSHHWEFSPTADLNELRMVTVVGALARQEVHGESAERMAYDALYDACRLNKDIREWVRLLFPKWVDGLFPPEG